ncbi:ABC transporter ATP-binding protein [Pontibacter harenae]|uniref:ABC transporter ATP-binding protein n=1 Tax=Pontibacter harenae TaxID=2894083 RepID=UPI001E33733B|nr:ABC transporter ATP-binding protein [Pontibacter harenae]MCC9169144.1 ABC transporter ATP-binding protein [Pontibacter harenae]
MITIKNLVISYGKEGNTIDSLNLTLAEGTINGIVGLNGAGKTTLLNAIYGIARIYSGEISSNGTRLTKKHMSYLVTENFFYSNITGREYLSLFQNELFNTDEWNELFRLPLDQIIDGYSTGMKKKLALLGVLKQGKPIMILDEPFNGLDMETCRVIRSILLQLRGKGKTVIITSHIMETLTNLCDYIHYLEKGKIKFSKGKADFAELEREMFESLENKNAKLIAKLLK